MAGLEIIVGAGLIVVALILGWSSRVSATGPVRRFAMHRAVEQYYVIGLMTMIVTGAVLVLLAMGAA
jgi:hypothetical protein